MAFLSAQSPVEEEPSAELEIVSRTKIWILVKEIQQNKLHAAIPLVEVRSIDVR